MWSKLFVTVGAVAGASGVVLGALAAHGLKSRLDVAALTNVATSSTYLLVHGLLLCLVGALAAQFSSPLALRAGGVLLLTGILCFCGGLTTAALTGTRAFATLAPFGGMALIGGWLAVAVFGMSMIGSDG